MNKLDKVTLEDRAEQELQLSRDGVAEISRALRALLADVFALYLKTKNFHWHMSGRQFRDYHLLLDEQGDQLFAMTDEIAERARKPMFTIRNHRKKRRSRIGAGQTRQAVAF